MNSFCSEKYGCDSTPNIWKNDDLVLQKLNFSTQKACEIFFDYSFETSVKKAFRKVLLFYRGSIGSRFWFLECRKNQVFLRDTTVKYWCSPVSCAIVVLYGLEQRSVSSLNMDSRRRCHSWSRVLVLDIFMFSSLLDLSCIL